MGLFKLFTWGFLIMGPLTLFMSDDFFKDGKGQGVSRYVFFSAWCFIMIAFLVFRIVSQLADMRTKNIAALFGLPFVLPILGALLFTLIDAIFHLYNIRLFGLFPNSPVFDKFPTLLIYCWGGVILIALYSLMPKDKYITLGGRGRGDRRFINREDFYTLGKSVREVSIKVLISTVGLIILLYFIIQKMK